MEPFEVAWDKAKLARVRDQIRAYRFPPEPANCGWRYGCDAEFLRELCAYWADGLDTDAVAANLNRFPQALARIDGLDLHVVHVVGEAGGRRPLLLTHGWPGSIFEFWRVIEPLAFPSRHGGRVEDAFDLVVPSLPGFGFSGKPTLRWGPHHGGFVRRAHARTRIRSIPCPGWRLGCRCERLARSQFPERVRAIHLNYLLVRPDGHAADRG